MMRQRFLSAVAMSSLTLVAAMAAAGEGAVSQDAKRSSNDSDLSDLYLAGDEITEEAIGRLAGQDWETVTLADARLTGAIVEGLRRAGSIRTLRLFGDGLSGQIPRLAAVEGLVGLEIGAPLTGRDLEAIGRLEHLESLNLPQEMTINVVGAREIARLERLKSLVLYNVNVDDAALVELRTLNRLESLDLTHTRITDAGLAATLKHLPRLRTLELHRHPEWHISQQLSDACLGSIGELPALEKLSLSGKITNAGLREIAHWPELKTLSIVNTEITSAGLQALERSNVERLILASGQLGDGEIALQHLKNCRNLKSVMVIGEPTGREVEWQRTLPVIDWSFSG